MHVPQIIVRGLVKPDGTLELGEPLHMPAGPVEVTVRTLQEPAASSENLLEFIASSRARMVAAGCHFMSDEEVQNYIAEMREDEDRIDEVYRRLEDEQAQQEGA